MVFSASFADFEKFVKIRGNGGVVVFRGGQRVWRYLDKLYNVLKNNSILEYLLIIDQTSKIKKESI